MTEQLVNDIRTTLSAGIDADDTTLTVTSATGMPATGNFRLWVGPEPTQDEPDPDHELMLATARTGTSITVTRGIEGTTAAPRSSGDIVVCILTVAALTQFVTENSDATQAELDTEAATRAAADIALDTRVDALEAASGGTQVVTPAAGHVSFDVADGETVLLFITDGTALILDAPDNPVQGQRFTLIAYGNNATAELSYTEGDGDTTGYWGMQYVALDPITIPTYGWIVREFVYTLIDDAATPASDPYGAWTQIAAPSRRSPYIVATDVLEAGETPGPGERHSFYTPVADIVYAGSTYDNVVGMALFGLAEGEQTTVVFDNQSASDWTLHIITAGASPYIDGFEVAAGTVRVLIAAQANGGLYVAADPLGVSGGAVESVNGETGVVVLDAVDVSAQPVDSDLTAIAALTTTSYGRSLLELANAAAGRTALGLGSAATAATGDFDAAGAAAAAQAASQPLDSDLTAVAALTTTSFGRSFLALADAAAARTLTGAAAATHTHAQSDVTNLVTDLATKIAATIADAKGDLIVATAADTVARKAVGGDGTTLFADATASSGDGLAYGLIDHPVPTGFYAAPAYSGIGSQAPSSGDIRWCPVRLLKRQTWDRISINVTVTTATGTYRLGVYGDTNGKPDALLNDLGTVDVSGTGVKELTISLSLAPGIYWLAALCQTTAGSATISVANTSTLIVNYLPRQSILNPTNAYVRTGVALGALPSPAAPTGPNSNGPVIGLRAA